MRFRDNDLAIRRVFPLHADCGGQHLEQVDRRGVGDDHFVFTCADQRGELVAQAARQFEPASRIPAADQTVAPFTGDDFLRAGQRGFRAGAQRITVQVDHAVGQRKGIAQWGDRVGRVAFEAGVAGQSHGERGALNSF